MSVGQPLPLSNTTIKESTSSGVVRFLLGDSNDYRISWCRDSVFQISTKGYPLINGEPLTVVDVLEKYVVLSQDCGQKNKYAVLLPRKNAHPEMVFENVVGYDDVNKNLILISKGNEKRSINVIIFNLVTECRQEYQLQKPCSATNSIECIADVKYELGQITISYYGDDDNTIQTERIRLSTKEYDNGIH